MYNFLDVITAFQKMELDNWPEFFKMTFILRLIAVAL